MVVWALNCSILHANQTLKLTSSYNKQRRCIGPAGHVIIRGSRSQRRKTTVLNTLRNKYNNIQAKRSLNAISRVYLEVKVKCQNFFQTSLFIPVQYSPSKTSISIAAKQAIPNPPNAVLSRIQLPKFISILHEKQNHQKDSINERPLVYFSSSKLDISQNDTPCVGSQKDEKKNKEIKQSEADQLDELQEDRQTHSQYDLLIQKVQHRETNTASLYSSVKQFVEMPVNSFFSFISQSNLLEKPEKVEKPVDDKTNDRRTTEVDEEKPKETATPLSLLDSLYQFIPYLSSTGPLDDGEKMKQAKLEEEEKEELRIQSQKDKIARKVEVNNQTRYLIQCIREANSLTTVCHNVDELKDHLLKHPDTRITAVKENAIREITHIYRTTLDEEILPSLRMTLALLGSVDPPKQQGVRVLCIDGGGCRGVLSLEIFRRLSELSGKKIHEMFDYICGVSTGAILAFLLGIKRLPMDDIESIYRELGSEVFHQSRLEGTRKLVMSHAYYNTETLQKILKTVFGNRLLIETAADEDTPKCSAVSTLVNRMMLKPFVWRNYSIVPGTRLTHWPGTCRGKLWEALRASSAAPGYFEEFKKLSNIHQDGGLLTNNPAGVAMNECSLLWPNAPIQCVVSVGTGRYEPTVGPTSDHFLSLKDKLLKVVDSATSVSEVHTVMYDLLPDGTYFRFNPFIREPLQLDDFQEEKLNMLVEDAHEYIERNDYKFRACVTALGNKHKIFAR